MVPPKPQALKGRLAHAPEAIAPIKRSRLAVRRRCSAGEPRFERAWVQRGEHHGTRCRQFVQVGYVVCVGEPVLGWVH
jgi:hypothetical protein